MHYAAVLLNTKSARTNTDLPAPPKPFHAVPTKRHSAKLLKAFCTANFADEGEDLAESATDGEGPAKRRLERENERLRKELEASHEREIPRGGI